MARPRHDIPVLETPAPSSVIDLLKILVAETGELIRSEAEVIKLEMQESTRAMIVGGIQAAIYGGVALLGVLSLLTFLILALGDWIEGDNIDVTGFWLSALIVGLVLVVVGSLMASKSVKRIGREIGLTKTHIELEKDKRLLREELHKIKEAVKP